MANQAGQWTPTVQGWGVQYQDAGDDILVKISKASAGQVSSTGKTDMTASTKGWVPIAIDGFKLSVMAGKALPKK